MSAAHPTNTNMSSVQSPSSILFWEQEICYFLYVTVDIHIHRLDKRNRSTTAWATFWYSLSTGFVTVPTVFISKLSLTIYEQSWETLFSNRRFLFPSSPTRVISSPSIYCMTLESFWTRIQTEHQLVSETELYGDAPKLDPISQAVKVISWEGELSYKLLFFTGPGFCIERLDKNWRTQQRAK